MAVVVGRLVDILVQKPKTANSKVQINILSKRYLSITIELDLLRPKYSLTAIFGI